MRLQQRLLMIPFRGYERSSQRLVNWEQKRLAAGRFERTVIEGDGEMATRPFYSDMFPKSFLCCFCACTEGGKKRE